MKQKIYLRVLTSAAIAVILVRCYGLDVKGILTQFPTETIHLCLPSGLMLMMCGAIPPIPYAPL